jgi:hypothetical protein
MYHKNISRRLHRHPLACQSILRGSVIGRREGDLERHFFPVVIVAVTEDVGRVPQEFAKLRVRIIEFKLPQRCPRLAIGLGDVLQKHEVVMEFDFNFAVLIPNADSVGRSACVIAARGQEDHRGDEFGREFSDNVFENGSVGGIGQPTEGGHLDRIVGRGDVILHRFGCCRMNCLEVRKSIKVIKTLFSVTRDQPLPPDGFVGASNHSCADKSFGIQFPHLNIFTNKVTFSLHIVLRQG